MGQVVEMEPDKVLEADDLGMLVIPADLLGHPEPFTRFLVERIGTKVFIVPEAVSAQESDQEAAFDRWQQQWKIVQQEVSKSWPAGVSAVDVVSEMRR